MGTYHSLSPIFTPRDFTLRNAEDAKIRQVTGKVTVSGKVRASIYLWCCYNPWYSYNGLSISIGGIHNRFRNLHWKQVIWEQSKFMGGLEWIYYAWPVVENCAHSNYAHSNIAPLLQRAFKYSPLPSESALKMTNSSKNPTCPRSWYRSQN